ncbi:MAG TPA: sodium/proton-translocating pyrophosphatase, partial [Clostridia bacterium]
MKTIFFIIAGIGVSLLAFVFVSLLYLWIKKQPSSNQKIEEVGKLIRKGAMTFLKKEYIILAKFAGVVCLAIFVFLPSPLWTVIANGTFVDTLLERFLIILAYIAGTAFSCVAGYIGIYIATIANVKTAEAAKSGIKPSFLCGFRGGAVMGLAVVGACLLGVGLAYLVYMQTQSSALLLGFSFGASSLALFAKAGGGIFTKTADISADLVG